MKLYDKEYGILDCLKSVGLLISFIFAIVALFCSSNLLRAILVAYFVIGGISDFLMKITISFIWGHKSLVKVGSANKTLLKKLRLVSWMPRTVGILERLIFTTSFILGRFEYIGIWLALKTIGSWKSNTGENNMNKNNLWRVTENIFLMGTAFSLILSFFGAISFWIFLGKWDNLLYKSLFEVH